MSKWTVTVEAPASPPQTEEEKKLAAIEADYRAGILSLRAIGKNHDCSEGYVRKKAKDLGWTRDLNKKIAERTSDLVRKEAVRSSVRTESGLSAATEKQIVEANAHLQKNIILAHRTKIQTQQELLNELVAELQAMSTFRHLLEEIGEVCRSEDKNGNDKINDAYRKIIEISNRIDGSKKAAEILKILIALEREAFGIKDGDGGEKETNPVTEMLDFVKARRNRLPIAHKEAG